MSTGKQFPIRAPQYWQICPKGGYRGIEYSKTLKKPLSSSTGFVSNTHIYHNACITLLVKPALEYKVTRSPLTDVVWSGPSKGE